MMDSQLEVSEVTKIIIYLQWCILVIASNECVLCTPTQLA